MKFTRLKSPCLIENPIGCMSSRYRKPNQVIQPWMFGDSATKATCLWLFGLPNLIPTKIVEPGGKHYFEHSNAMGLWYYNTSKFPVKERAKVRSKTFPGIAKAIAQQYTRYLKFFCGVE